MMAATNPAKGWFVPDFDGQSGCLYVEKGPYQQLWVTCIVCIPFSYEYNIYTCTYMYVY